MKTVVIYHEAVSKLVFIKYCSSSKLSLILKLFATYLPYRLSSKLLFIIKIIIVLKILLCTVKIVFYHGNCSY